LNGGWLSTRWSACLAVGLGKTIVAAGQPNPRHRAALHKGELTLEDAERVVALLTGLRQAFEGADLAARLAKRRHGLTRSRPEQGKEEEESDHALEFLGDDRLGGRRRSTHST